MLTQVLYPIAYWEFMIGTPWIVLLAAVRNVALVVLFVGAVVQLVRLGRGASASAASTDGLHDAQATRGTHEVHGTHGSHGSHGGDALATEAATEAEAPTARQDPEPTTSA